MFVDGTKRTMATVEARTDVPTPSTPTAAGLRRELLSPPGRRGARGPAARRPPPDAAGRTPWRIDPSVIATDVESVRAGKALGARRALDLLGADGPLPRVWHTVGDSRSDYAMADQLHACGTR